MSLEAGYLGGEDSTGSVKWGWDTVLAVEIMRRGDSDGFKRFYCGKIHVT